MSLETPIEIAHIPPQLHADFDSLLPAATSDTPENREANFLSRALAAYSIHKLSGSSLKEAADSVVDGGGDGGIDAIYFAPATRILWVVQSKFHRDGRGEPDLGSVTKFKTGLEHLLQGNFDAFSGNAAWVKVIPMLSAVMKSGGIQVRALLVYSGMNFVSEDRRRLFEDLRNRFSSDSDYLQWDTYNLTTIHDWVTGADQNPGVPQIELKISKPGWVQRPYETIYGLLPLADLAKLYQEHGRKLIVANIRAYKGDTEVNNRITETVKNEPEHFFYLNNGLTAYCDRFELNNFDRGNAEYKRLTAFGFSIVNGAQTLGSIAGEFATNTKAQHNGYVFIKIISLANCPDDKEFAGRITRSTNYQNQVRPKDFISLTEQQERIANQLILEGIYYHYKDGDDTPSPDSTNFTLDEATTACATLANGGDCDFAARILANRASLWSLDEDYPNDLLKSRYSKVFKPDLSARTIWRAVQSQRVVIKALRSTESGLRKQFFENCRWIVFDLILKRIHPERGESISLSEPEILDLTQKAQNYAELLWESCREKGFVSISSNGGWESTHNFRSVFCSATDCQLLRSATFAKIATPSSASLLISDPETNQPSTT